MNVCFYKDRVLGMKDKVNRRRAIWEAINLNNSLFMEFVKFVHLLVVILNY